MTLMAMRLQNIFRRHPTLHGTTMTSSELMAEDKMAAQTGGLQFVKLIFFKKARTRDIILSVLRSHLNMTSSGRIRFPGCITICSL